MSWNLSWTLAGIGLGWLFVSCAVALALGRMIQRSKAMLVPEGAVNGQHASDFSNVAESEEQDDGQLDETGCRAASGTRLRPVRMDETAAGSERKVS
jgi:hypothetical protein